MHRQEPRELPGEGSPELEEGVQIDELGAWEEVAPCELMLVRDGISVRELGRLPALLAPQRAFEAVGVSRSKGYEMLKAGSIPSVALAGRRWVRTVDLAREVFGIELRDLLGGDGRE